MNATTSRVINATQSYPTSCLASFWFKATRGYDLNGSLTSESKPSGTTAYRYDVTNRMVGIDTDNDGNDETTYAYNDQGVRISQTDVATSTTTTYLIDPNNPTGYAKQIEELVNGSLTRSFTLGLMIHGQHDAASGAVVLLHDGHGSTRLLTNVSQAIIESYTYTAFGDALGFTADAAATAWLFANDGIYDKASGLTYHLARYRSGHVFTQTDPFSGYANTPLSLHKRMYVHGNPVMAIDVNGMFTLSESLATISNLTQRNLQRANQGLKVSVVAYRQIVRAAVIMNLTIAMMDPKLTIFASIAAPYQFAKLNEFGRIPKGQIKASILSKIMRISTHMTASAAIGAALRTAGIPAPLKANGLPDFTAFQNPNRGVTFIPLSGYRKKDRLLANTSTLRPSEPKLWLWHHHEVMGIMQLVPAPINQAFKHIGGTFFWEIVANEVYKS